MYAPYQTATEWLIIGELIFVGFAALLRNRRQGGDASSGRLGIMGLIVGLSDFLAVIFALLVASKATIAFGTFWGLIIIIVTSALAGVTLALTIAARRGLDISAKDTLTAPRRHPLPSLVGGVAGYVVVGLPGLLIGAIFGASLSHGQRVRKSKMTAAQLVSPLAATLAVPESDLTDGSCRWEIRHESNGDAFIFPHPSARMLSKIDGIPARCATYLPDHYLAIANAQEIVLSPLDDETLAQRERSAQLAEQHEGLVVDIRPSESSTPTTDSGEGTVDLDLSGEDF